MPLQKRRVGIFEPPRAGGMAVCSGTQRVSAVRFESEEVLTVGTRASGNRLGLQKGRYPERVVEFTPEYYRKLQATARKRKSRGYRKSSALEFYYRQNWDVLREEFFSRLDPRTGAYLYQKLEHFWRVKFKSNEKHQQWAGWVTGPEPTRVVPWKGNWALERFARHWLENQHVKKVAEQLEQEIDAARLAYSTAPLFLECVGRAKKLMMQVDEEFRGWLFLEGLDEDTKFERAERYVHLVERLQSLLREAVDGLIESAGGKRSLSAIVLQRFIEGHERSAQTPEEQDEQVQGIIRKLLHVAVERNRLFGTELPDPDKVMKKLQEESVGEKEKRNVEVAKGA
jgi:hypothetical protein